MEELHNLMGVPQNWGEIYPVKPFWFLFLWDLCPVSPGRLNFFFTQNSPSKPTADLRP